MSKMIPALRSLMLGLSLLAITAFAQNEKLPWEGL